jgi:hypothetical protein
LFLFANTKLLENKPLPNIFLTRAYYFLQAEDYYQLIALIISFSNLQSWEDWLVY